MKKTTILLGALSLSFLTTGQIQYTAFTQDTVITSGIGGIDVDNDGFTDFDFSVNGFGASLFGVGISTFNEIAVDNLATFPNNCFASYIFSGIQINGQYKWADFKRNTRLDDQSKKNFIGQGESFIGFRFDDGTDYFYGWIMLELTNNVTLRIKGFAMESSPNKPIIVGDTGSGVIGLEETPKQTFEMYPTNVVDNFNLEFSSNMQKIEIVNITGKVVYERVVHNVTQCTVPFASAPAGVYILNLTNNKGVRTSRKFVKSN